MPITYLSGPLRLNGDEYLDERDWTYVNTHPDGFQYVFDRVTFDGDTYLFPDPLIVHFVIFPNPTVLSVRITGKPIKNARIYHYDVADLRECVARLNAIPEEIYTYLVRQNVIIDERQNTISEEAYKRLMETLGRIRAERVQ